MRRKKYYYSLLLTALLLVGAGKHVSAKEESAYTETSTYETDVEGEEREGLFSSKVTVKGKKYKLYEVTYSFTEKEKEKQVFQTEPGEKEHIPQPTRTVNGCTYELESSEEKEVVTEEEYLQTVSAYSEYDHPVTKEEVPATKKVRVENEKTKESEEVLCRLTHVHTVDAGWKETYIDILFEDYDSGVFIWNDLTIENDTETPLVGYETELLQSVGADPTEYQILSTKWLGEAYTDESGVLCRKARADVRKHCINYRAEYEGEIRVEEEIGTQYIDTYTYVKGEGDRYVVEAVGHYKEDHLIQYLTIGAVIVIFLLIIVLLLISKKKKEEEKENE